MDERIKMMLLLTFINAGSSSLAKYLISGASPSDLWAPGKADIAQSIFGEKRILALRRANAEAWAEREYERAYKLGVTILSIEDEAYPAVLTELKDAPLILYVRGSTEILHKKQRTGVVGTRRMSRYGKGTARSIGEICAKYMMPLISGGAWGVDSEAQRACCENGGDTAAVLGTGVDISYPPANAALFETITARGALISEFPLGSSGAPWHFPQRNRIIAALSEKLIVVEAPMKSGSMITARTALELGREIWAVPGQIDSPNSEGTNRLIYDGAFPYISDEVFLSSCGLSVPQNASLQAAFPDGLSPEDRKILTVLSKNKDMTIDNLSISVKMGAADLLKNIALLSSKGLVFMSAPGRYSTKCKE